MAKYTFTQLKAGYTALWNEARVTRVAPAKSQAELILAHKKVYLETERRTGVPWWAVGIMHIREAGPADVGQWKRVLHNGERIIGTGRKTTIVPKGRGPFTDWQVAAYDALVTIKHFNVIKEWTPERVAHVLESYNGFGYRGKGIPSPYLWGGTSVQRKGKYVRDGVYDPNVMDQQIGGMAILKELMKLDSSIKFGEPKPTSVPTVGPKPVDPPVAEAGGAATVGFVGVITALLAQPENIALILGGTVIAGMLVWGVVRWYKERMAFAELQKQALLKQTKRGKKNG